jgi:hypothetical protein
MSIYSAVFLWGIIAGSAIAPNDQSDFSNYWYTGQAEITSYELSQARYGELREGEAVMIFVTEDFSEKELVKMNDPQDDPKNKVTVLKLNTTKDFITGIYPYKLMMSVFTPIRLKERPRTFRVTATTQDWCGHTFTSIDRSKKKYRVWGHSYFDGEGDFNEKLDGVFLEDAIWTTLRMNPKSLPTGDFEMIPASWYMRLLHSQIETVQAKGSLKEHQDDNRLNTYVLEVLSQNRSLSIHFQKFFPYEIEGWEESYPSGGGENAQVLTTVATKNVRIMSDYWNHNSIADSTFRNQLKFEE